MTERSYSGDPDTRGVDVHHEDGTIQPLNPRFDMRMHSPDGFSWGYGGSGPAQLALALCADVLQDDARAARLYQRFKERWVAKLGIDEAWAAKAADLDAIMKGIERDTPETF